MRWNGKGFNLKGNEEYEIKTGKGWIKEYSHLYGFLKFEGDYINGERNGKGKEYDFYTGKLLFEGEYLNGKRNGKGREYDYHTGKLEFEGEYLNDERNGKGKEYDIYGDVLFGGEDYKGKKMDW